LVLEFKMRKNILLVEYAVSTIDRIRDMFPPPVFDITVVEEGDAAKDLLSKNNYDLMITAAMLPKFHGFNLSYHAATHYPDLKIVIISEIYKGLDYKHQAITQYKASDFFEKPLNAPVFKKRILELLEIDEKMMAGGTGSSTSEVPPADTTKVPTLQRLEEMEEKKQLSSEDLFGDIINKVQDSKAFEIKLDEEVKKAPPKPKEDIAFTRQMPGLTRVPTPPPPPPPSAPSPKKEEDILTTQLLPDLEALKRTVKIKTPPPSQMATQKIDLGLEDLIKPGKKEEKPPQEKEKFKKIEDDISKRFEETLSGLGIKSKQAPAPTQVLTPTPTPTQVYKPEPSVPPVSTPKPSPKPAPPSPPKPAPEAGPVTVPIKTAPVTVPVKTAPVAPPPAAPNKDTRPMKTSEVEKRKAEEAKREMEEVGGYDILGLIARGGMAEIFKAKKKGVKGFEKIIAIKKILAGFGKDDKYVEMFVDEAKIAAELSHPNIVQIYDLGKKDDYYFIAMEYVAGKDLRIILRKLAEMDQRFPEELSIYLVLKVLEALNYAHSAKNSSGKNLDIVHRDISPPNILVSYSGEVKLTDFGVSKASIKLHHTVAGALKGKLLYMSPEQARADKDVDYRSDLYSAGIILFELLTGEKLFMGHSEMAVLQKVQAGEIIPPSHFVKDIDSQLESIVMRMLERDKAMRFPKASDIINQLQHYLSMHYDHAPTSSHLSHALCSLFKDEIEKEGTKIDLKPIPYVISKREKTLVEPEPEPDTRIETLTGPVASELEVKVEEDSSPELDELIKAEEKAMAEEFHPLVEIDFGDDLMPDEFPPITPPPTQAKAVTKELATPPASPIFDIADSGEDEFKKKKKYLFIALAIIVILGAVIAIYLITASNSGAPVGKDELTVSEQVSSPDLTTIDTTDTTFSEESGIETNITSMEPKASAAGETVEKTTSKEDIPAREPAAAETTKAKTGEITAESITTGMEEPPVTPKKKEEPVVKDEPKTIAEPKTEKVESKAEKIEPKTEKVEPKADAGKEAAEISSEEQKQPEQAKIAEEQQKQLELLKQKEEERKRLEAEMNKIKEGDTVSINEVDVAPVPVSMPPIELTNRETRALNAAETVMATYLIDHNGNVETVRIIKKSSVKRINDLIEKTIGGWKFKPAIKNNVKVKVWKTIPLTIKK
jgi:serine/threonine protein kinase/DNA-binding response OmpR family regulator/outer membrane biosynthesis protein TonB